MLKDAHGIFIDAEDTVYCVRVDRNDQVLVADRANNRIQIFDTEGRRARRRESSWDARTGSGPIRRGTSTWARYTRTAGFRNSFDRGKSVALAGGSVNMSKEAPDRYAAWEKYRNQVVHPATVYSTDDFSRARENLERHAWARRVMVGMVERIAHTLEQGRTISSR